MGCGRKPLYTPCAPSETSPDQSSGCLDFAVFMKKQKKNKK